MQKQQKGVALVICMVLLLLLMMISITGMRSTILQEKMAFAVKDSNLALVAAESALLEAENYLMQPGIRPESFTREGTVKGLYLAGFAPSPFEFVASADDSAAMGGETTESGIWDHAIPATEHTGRTQAPRFYIEMVGPVPGEADEVDPMFCGYDCKPAKTSLMGFRIYAIGFGSTEFSYRVLTSFFARAY